MSLGISISRSTALRRLREIPLPEPAPTSVIGIDDSAFRKGNNYGTIIVDQQTHRPIDVLPAREAETVASWLHEHPGIEVVSRNRSGAYASGISQGAPDAVQVADRFHLIVNTIDTLVRVLETRRSLVRDVARDCLTQRRDNIIEEKNNTAPEPITVDILNELEKSSKARRVALERRTWRLQQYEEVITLRKRGYGIRAIAKMMDLAPDTIRTWIRSDGFPERAPRIY